MKFIYEIAKEDFVSAGQASSNVKKILKELGINSNIIKRTVIAMYEAEINAVIHGHGGQALIDIDEEQIKIDIIDNGPGIADVSFAMTEGYSTASDSIRELGFGAGMGLPNIKKNVDDLKIISEVGKGTIVKLIVNFK